MISPARMTIGYLYRVGLPIQDWRFSMAKSLWAVSGSVLWEAVQIQLGVASRPRVAAFSGELQRSYLVALDRRSEPWATMSARR